MMPRAVTEELHEQLVQAQLVHQEDLAVGFGRVWLPDALAKKFPNAPADWRWQWDSRPRPAGAPDGQEGRHHIHETSVQRTVQRAAMATDVGQRVTCHPFRHSFATHLPERGHDIRAIEELLGHRDVATTMIYTHVLRHCARGVKSPLDPI